MVTICLQCGDKGFENAFVYCVKCLNFAVHRYCLDDLPKTYDEFVPWVCDYCEAESGGLAHQKSGAKPQGDTCLEHIKVNSLPKSNSKIINRLAATAEKEHGLSGPVLQSAQKRIDPIEEAQSAGDFRPSRVRQKANDDSCHKVNTAKEQTHQSSNSEKLHEDENVEVVADSSPRTAKLEKKDAISSLVARKENQRLRRMSDQFRSRYQNKFDNNAPSRRISPMRNKLKNKYISRSMATIAAQRSKSLSSRQAHEARRSLHSAVREREAKNGKQEVLVIHTRIDVTEEVPRYPIISRPIIAEDHYLIHAQPLVDPIWRGSFNITNNNGDVFEGFVAHLSSRACQMVYEETRLLPPSLHLEMLHKASVWPKSFEKSEPTDDNIALYIFPAKRRYERSFDYLVDKMMRRDLALRAVTENAELLIFPSTDLPLLWWKFRNNYYLWGVFRGKRSPSPVAADKQIVSYVGQYRIDESGKFRPSVKDTGIRNSRLWI